MCSTCLTDTQLIDIPLTDTDTDTDTDTSTISEEQTNQKYKLFVSDKHFLNYISQFRDVRKTYNDKINDLKREFDTLYKDELKKLEQISIDLSTKWAGVSVKYRSNSNILERKITGIGLHMAMGQYDGCLEVYLEQDPIVSLSKTIRPKTIDKDDIVDNDQLFSDLAYVSLNTNVTLSRLYLDIDKFRNKLDDELKKLLRYLKISTNWQTIPVWFWTGSEYQETRISYFELHNDLLIIYIDYMPKLSLSDTWVPRCVSDSDVEAKN